MPRAPHSIRYKANPQSLRGNAAGYESRQPWEVEVATGLADGGIREMDLVNDQLIPMQREMFPFAWFLSPALEVGG